MPAATPRTYTPTHLAERILTSRSGIEGERKQVTVLFADVKGSMELLADRDAEEARELLDAVLERMMEAVHRYEGTVNQVMGDGIMALFGAPLAREDHGVRACFAALRMQDEFARYAEELRRTRGLPLHIRIGVNSGEVVVRSISNDLYMDYTAVGQTTHLAARLEQMAEPGSAFISASTLRLAGQSVAVKPLGPRPVRGLDAPIEVYELAGATPLRSIARVAAVHRASRFVAREGELAQLHHQLEKVRSVSGRAVGIVGEAGVGKSRLIYEFINSQPCRVIGSCALSYENAASWAPVIDLLRSYFEVDTGQQAEQIIDQVAAKMRALDSALEGDIAPILSLLDALPDSDGFRALDARDRRQRLLSAQTRLILAQSEQGPLVLVFENLQWVDEESRAFLDALMAQLPRSRLMLLMNYRPDFEHDWHGREGFSQSALEPLPPEDARELLAALLGEDPSVVAVYDGLIERSNGNPFFLEEIVNTLIETKAIVGEPGARKLVSKVDALNVPPTVQAVIAARIDRLPREDKSLLQQAAVIGIDVPLALLEAVTEVPDEVARRSLRSLQTASFIHQTNLFPDLEYRFRHSLTRDVAYSSLLKDQRRILHAQAVYAIERLYADRLASHLDDLASHAMRGELWDKAVEYNRQLGMRAQKRAANAEAVSCFEDALRALSHLPVTRAAKETEIDLRNAMRPALLQLGRLDEIYTISRQVEQLALELGDQQRLAQAYSYLINYHYLKGETTLTIDYGKRCIAIAEACGDVSIQALARQYMGQGHHARGDYLLAERELKRNIASRDLAGSGPTYVSSCAWLAFSLAERGEFEAAASYARDAQQVAEASGQIYQQMIALTFAGLVAIRRGYAGRAVLPLQRSYEICCKRGLTVWQPISSSLLGLALARLGNEREAMRLLEDSVALSRQLGVTAYLAMWMTNLAEGQLAIGQREHALRTSEAALCLAREAGERGHEAYALWLLGGIKHTAEPYEDALGITLELGMRPLAAQTHIDYGRQLASAGNSARAEEQMGLGRQLVRRMNMRAWYDDSPTDPRENSHIYIVARSNPQLYEFLTQEFTGDQGITVVLDRRERAHRQITRDEERRLHPVDDDLRAWELALTSARHD
jgi:class 3 adenylate cyclase/tetratricopeptide (TPR) repeat protein